jgi:superfamily II DNA or RNA helicase
MFADRDYQTAAENAVMEAFKTLQSVLLVLATGLGKTICFARIIQLFQPKRAMVLADTDELIIQAVNKIKSVTGLAVEIEKADLYASTDLFHKTPVVVSSIQTQISGPKERRRYMRFKPDDFGLLVCDEAHLCAAPSWRETIAYYKQNPNLKVLGVTATPDRADNQPLVPGIFDRVAFEFGISEGIKGGWLVEISQQFINVESLDISHIETKAGDLNQGQLAKVMEMEENIQRICQPSLEAMWALPPMTLSTMPPTQWREYLKSLNRKPRRTIVFTVTVDQARMCAEVFNRAMEGVEWVSGSTSKNERPEILGRFMEGKTTCIANAMLLGKGYDNPWVELICQARPTKSRTLYAQHVGRGTRTLPGIIDEIPVPELRRAAIARSDKPILRVLDFVGNSGRHKLVSCIDILGDGVSDKAKELARDKAIKEGKPLRIMATMTNAEFELQRKQREEAERLRLEAAARKNHLLAKSNYTSQAVDPFGNDSNQERIPLKYGLSRDGRQYSEKQLRILRLCGCDPNRYPYRQGQAIISSQIAKWKKQRAA